MAIRKQTLYLWLTGAMAAFGLSWALAATVVISHPATITGSVSFGAETLTKFTVLASLATGGGSSEKTYNDPQNLTSYELIVEGGDPSDPSDNGLDYWIGFEAYFANDNLVSTLHAYRNTLTHVDNTTDNPNDHITAVDFWYPETTRANFSISVSGGTIAYYSIWASGSGSTASSPTVVYNGATNKYLSSPSLEFASSWVPMVRVNHVSLTGGVGVLAPDGSVIEYQLSPKVIDLSQGPVNVSWSIDHTNRGQLAGIVSLTTATPIYYGIVGYQGVYGTSTAGISGSCELRLTSNYTADYSASLPAGKYDVYLSVILAEPDPDTLTSAATSTQVFRIDVTAGELVTKDFVEVFGKGHVPLEIAGFYKNTDLSSTMMILERRDPASSITGQSTVYGIADGRFNFELSNGTWLPSQTWYSIVDMSDPNMPINNDSMIFHISDANHPPVTVPPGGDRDFTAESITLVRSNLYFEVTPRDGGSPDNVSDPVASIFRYIRNSDNTTKSYMEVTAHGAPEGRPQSALTMIAPPGTYQINARATVNGAVRNFANRSITFGEPIPTPAGSGVEVDLTAGGANVGLNFSNVTTPGVTTVVESPLGPAPPEGFQTICMSEFSCDTIYYDIQSSADWEAPDDCSTQSSIPTAMVCIEHKFFLPDGSYLPNGAADGSLRLWHYNHATTCGQTPHWEQLDAPVAAYSCVDDSSPCHCGLDCEGVFRVCGVTTSFSPTMVGAPLAPPAVIFTSQGHTGRNGPPLQTWSVPVTGTYRIIATGASGGHPNPNPSNLHGGCGAQISGEFVLAKDQVLQILVGQQGASTPQNAGGGGGTFVVKAGSPLIIAGGGGGVRSLATVNGRNGSLTKAGVAGSTTANYATASIAGGTGGSGGAHVSSYGSGGGGWSGNGEADGIYGEGGFAFTATGTNQGRGGTGKSCGGLADGGYGGGGAGNGCYGAGGGGGYSGGGGGRVAGGGGSWNEFGANPHASVYCMDSGDDGKVQIDWVRP